MASPLPHSTPLLTGLRSRPFKSNLPSQFQFRYRNPNPRFTSSAASPSSSSWEREEARWLREEQRWTREEQRWLREEQRWKSERESLLTEIAALRLRIEALEHDRRSIDTVLAPAPPPPLLSDDVDVKEMVFEEIRVVENKREERMEDGEPSPRRVLRKGSEGDDVRALQEALQKIGFYSGEEDMEFASFSSGTERAVKTWQASLGSQEDGIMTLELLKKLFMQQETNDATVKDGTNGTAVTSLKQFTEVQENVIKKTGDAEVKVSQPRVFLLGENRWEEPSRLIGRDEPVGVSKVVSATKCLQCRGEGRLLCTECDGTGEPNIEPQFLEWVDEGAKCPYCEGLGYTTCDACQGKAIIKT